MEFPNLVYKSPGSFSANGGSYKFKQVAGQAEYDAAIADGWAASIDEAINGKEDNAPPTRAELEEQADKLGIKYDGRTGDAKLLAKIESALRGE